MLYGIMKHAVLGPPLRALYRPHVEGLEHIPAEGPAILASNHLSFSDSIFLPLVVDRKITFLAKAEYFTGPGVKGWMTKHFMSATGQVPIDRTGGRASVAAIGTGIRVLREGSLLGVYPEGTRSPDGRLYRGRTGPARMALAAPAPVIPVAMIGTDRIQPTGQKVPNLAPLEIRIGPPLDFSRYAGMEDDRFVLRSMTDEIMYELMLLSGQEYVDVYASRAKELIRRYGTSTPTPEQVAQADATLKRSA
ncbi:MAG: 1-acyl-sn-glycerol-3-phosphate acyltransferase [Candidatus Nanopelagicales bacterium]|jgi:1-acyl-sn-glycerol-3-phosphate acyltransferase|nr:1-acyl-sn-glycerol-3-phosphate acyltransferase [Candidatus Nanopelagicales bacterium]